jgi:hypothetical protein
MTTRNNPSEEIRKMWRIFRLDSNGILQLRAIPPSGINTDLRVRNEHFRVDKFSSIRDCQFAFETRALQLNESGYNVYIVMNPIRSDFSSGAASDEHILCRRLLLVDIDRAGEKKFPASQSELDAALVLAKSIKSYAATLDFPDPTMVMSGNGYHLYYRLPDLENTPETTVVIQRVLNDLAGSFNTGSISVDTKVYNASRVTKVPGTVMRKGVPMDDRPYRVAVVCDEE